jgi:hypothetical protein
VRASRLTVATVAPTLKQPWQAAEPPAGATARSLRFNLALMNGAPPARHSLGTPSAEEKSRRITCARAGNPDQAPGPPKTSPPCHLIECNINMGIAAFGGILASQRAPRPRPPHSFPTPARPRPSLPCPPPTAARTARRRTPVGCQSPPRSHSARRYRCPAPARK